MTRNQIIAGLIDNVADRRALVPQDEPDSIFARDAQVMDEAVQLINKLREENLRLRAHLFPWRLFRP